MDEIISYKMCAVKVRNAKLRNYLKKYSREPTRYLTMSQYPQTFLTNPSKLRFT